MKHFRLFLLIIVLYSCSSDSDEEMYLSSNKSLFSFSIKELPGLTFTGLSQSQLVTSLTTQADVTSLTAIFEVSKGATVYIGETVQKSGTTTNNFSNKITYTIKAEDGSIANFSVTINPYANHPPVAHAGNDQILYLPAGGQTLTVTLDASESSDLENQELDFEWLLDDNIIADTEQAEVALALGTYNITLVVTDPEGASDTDDITVEIRELSTYAPIDSGASEQTRNVLNNLAALAYGETFAFGQEFPLSFQLSSLNYDLSTSDCKDVSGDHPAVFGIDPHYMLYKGASERQLHIDEAKAAYANGSVVTFDFHQQSKTDGQIYYDQLTTDTDKSLMYDIVNDLNGSRDWYFDEIDMILDIINNDLGFTIIFRPLHEMNGGWFWWGTETANHSPELYIALYQMTVDYMKERTDHVLFAWSPNYPFDESYYPGDAYVDVVGIDYYTPSKTSLKQVLIELTDFAEQHHKIAALTETGQQNYIFDNTDFWTDNILAAIEEGGSEIRIAWALGWFNAPWDSSQNNLFIPNAQSPQNAKDDFIAFKNSSKTLFQEDIQALDMYLDPGMN
ncbi:MAG: glycosyl hydrolase [Allomuricauda sp.]